MRWCLVMEECKVSLSLILRLLLMTGHYKHAIEICISCYNGWLRPHMQKLNGYLTL